MPRDRRAERILKEKADRSGGIPGTINPVKSRRIPSGGTLASNTCDETSALDTASENVDTGSPGVGNKKRAW